MAAFALSMPYSTCDLWNSGVSWEFRYFGSPLPTTRPPKAMHSPCGSLMGNMMRL